VNKTAYIDIDRDKFS